MKYKALLVLLLFVSWHKMYDAASDFFVERENPCGLAPKTLEFSLPNYGQTLALDLVE